MIANITQSRKIRFYWFLCVFCLGNWKDKSSKEKENNFTCRRCIKEAIKQTLIYWWIQRIDIYGSWKNP